MASALYMGAAAARNCSPVIHILQQLVESPGDNTQPARKSHAADSKEATAGGTPCQGQIDSGLCWSLFVYQLVLQDYA